MMSQAFKVLLNLSGLAKTAEILQTLNDENLCCKFVKHVKTFYFGVISCMYT